MTIPAIPAPGDIHDRKREFESAVRTALNGQGYTEVLNYSFISGKIRPTCSRCPGRMSAAGLYGSPIRSPRTRPSLRSTLLNGLLDTMRRNVNAGSPDLKLFELGNLYCTRPGGAAARGGQACPSPDRCALRGELAFPGSCSRFLRSKGVARKPGFQPAPGGSALRARHGHPLSPSGEGGTGIPR